MVVSLQFPLDRIKLVDHDLVKPEIGNEGVATAIVQNDGMGVRPFLALWVGAGAAMLDHVRSFPKLSVGGEPDREHIPQGSLVEFYVNGFKADQTALFQNDHPEEINLAALVPPTLPGDATGDGKVNAVDITKVDRIIVGLAPETPGADANQDGRISAIDITKVERIVAGLD